VARDTVGKTFLVATVLCVVCSILVSSAAVLLRPAQELNKKIEKNKNILIAAGLCDASATKETVEELFAMVKVKVVDLETGEYTDKVDPTTYDQKTAARDPEQSIKLETKADIAGIRNRENYAFVYLIEKDGKIEQFVLPVHGYGLWSTLYGFLAIEGDLQTVKGLTFYEHLETPGLGGEVDNPKWKSIWPGKQVYGKNGKVALQVIRGSVDPTLPNDVTRHQVDGLAGATITSRGVSNMIQYWVGDAFAKYIERVRSDQQKTANTPTQKKSNDPRGV
jgi:Na+-transporting NADH:ubiquinone oxidoreductase subunit C